MVATATPTSTGRRPTAVWTTIGTLAFLGMTAVAGGVAMVLDLGTPPDDWLVTIPLVDTWIVPGLVLGIGFGLGSLLTGYAMLRRPRWAWLRPVERLTRHHWSWIATVLIGLCHIAWIVVELVYLPQPSLLQVVYGGVGVALLVLPLLPTVRRDLSR
jgi:hypothetical protein